MNRAAYVLMTTVSSLGMALTAAVPMPLKLIWNVSASVPVGLYSSSRLITLKSPIWSR